MLLLYYMAQYRVYDGSMEYKVEATSPSDSIAETRKQESQTHLHHSAAVHACVNRCSVSLPAQSKGIAHWAALLEGSSI